MKVHEILNPHVHSCGTDLDLAQAGALVGSAGWGWLPVVDGGGRVTGVISDRLICRAVSDRHKRAEQLLVADVMSPEVTMCREDDEVAAVLRRMASEHVRRLPVVDAMGVLRGTLSLDDILLAYEEGRGDLPKRSVVDALRAVRGGAKPGA